MIMLGDIKVSGSFLYRNQGRAVGLGLACIVFITILYYEIDHSGYDQHQHDPAIGEHRLQRLEPAFGEAGAAALERRVVTPAHDPGRAP